MLGFVLFRQEGPPVSRRHTQRVKKARRYPTAGEPLRLIAIRDIKVVLLNGDEMLSGVVLFPPVGEIRRGYRAVHIADCEVLLPDHDESLLMGKVEGPENQGVSRAEDRRIR